MKSKKHLGLVSAMLGVCLTVSSFSAFTALADDTATDNKTYTVNANNVDRANHFANKIDYFTVTNGTNEVDFDAKDIKSVAVYAASDTSVELESGTAYVYDSKEGTIKYAEAGEYVLGITIGETVYNVPVTVVGEDGVTLSYNTVTAEDRTAFQTEIKNAISALDEDSTSVDLPETIWDFINSNVYESENLMVKLYVASAGGSFSAVKSSFDDEMPEINLSASGTYEFYVEVQDPDGNTIVKESEYVQKTDGWYEVTTNDNGTPDDETDDTEVEELKIPIFKFDYTKVTKLEVTTKGGGESGVHGIVGQEYTSIKFTSNGTQNKLTLLYSKTIDGTYEEATEKEATYGTLSVSSTSFTPLKKGYYKIVLNAKGGEDGFATETKESEVVVVDREIQKQKLVNVKFRNFMKNNWLSIVFLGIALLCVVGIIILALYKPKDEAPKAKTADKIEDDAVETVEDDTTETVEEVEEAEEVETVEENEEIVEETTEETETVEEVTEEATEETTETAETTEEVATEETATETVEEVKNEGENA